LQCRARRRKRRLVVGLAEKNGAAHVVRQGKVVFNLGGFGRKQALSPPQALEGLVQPLDECVVVKKRRDNSRYTGGGLTERLLHTV
jgi:hypothetical protein